MRIMNYLSFCAEEQPITIRFLCNHFQILFVEAESFTLCFKMSGGGTASLFYESGYFSSFQNENACGINVAQTCLLAVRATETDEQRGFMM